MADAVFLVTTLPTNHAMTADISGGQYRMLRLFGLFVCVSLAFVFPSLVYEYNPTTTSLDIIATVFSCIIVMLIFSNYGTAEEILHESK